jgi:hypothetical protein
MRQREDPTDDGGVVVVPVRPRPVDPGPVVAGRIDLDTLPADRIWPRRVVRQPPWIDVDRHPHTHVEPVPALSDPVIGGDHLLWVDDAGGRVFYAAQAPRLIDAQVTVYKQERDDTIQTTGGTAVVTVAVYDDVDAATLVALEQGWRDVLALGGHGTREWTFLPLSLRSLEPAVDVGAELAAGTPQVNASTEAGTATFVIPLSSMGAQIWRAALQMGAGLTVPGACSVRAHYLADLGTTMEARDHELSCPLGTLLAAVPPAAVRELDAEVSFDANVIVGGHPTVDKVLVDWTPSEGHSPESLTFDSAGGTYSAALTSQHPQDVTIDWHAQVLFRPPGWPAIVRSGTLSVASNDWAVVLKPSSWLLDYTINAVHVDADGNALDVSLLDPATRVQATLACTAPYLGPNGLKSTLFETEHEDLVKVCFPCPPDQPAGQVRLTVFATRDGKLRMKRRTLKPSESLVAVLIKPQAVIQILTSEDPGAETTRAGDPFARMRALAG